MSTGLKTDKLPPQNLDAEQSVLGSILIENNAIYRALELIGPDDFYRESHRKIFLSMVELFEKGEAIDLITVSERLSQKKLLEEVGSAEYLSTLATQVPTAANINYHAKIIREKAVFRFLLRSVSEIAEKAYEASIEADELLDFAEKSIFEISDKRIKVSFESLRTIIKDSFKHIEELYDKKDTISGVPSGFKDIDDKTTGFQKGDLIIIGARPSMGKTALALNIAQNVALELKEPVALFSLEMSKQQLAMRLLCSEARVDSNLVRKGIIPKESWHKLTSAAGRLTEAPIYIDDSSTINVLEMRAKARRLKKEHGSLSLVIVDYLQLMRSWGTFERREQEISDISRSLKSLARELDVPVIALSQLNRGVELRAEKIPTLADLRESGAIEQDADLILFIYRDEVYTKEKSKHKGKADIYIAKQRNGPTGKIILSFLSESARFANYTGYDDPSYEDNGYDGDNYGSSF